MISEICSITRRIIQGSDLGPTLYGGVAIEWLLLRLEGSSPFF